MNKRRITTSFLCMSLADLSTNKNEKEEEEEEKEEEEEEKIKKNERRQDKYADDIRNNKNVYHTL